MKRIKIGLIAAVLVGIVALYSYIDKASPIYDRQIDSSMYGSTGGLLDGEIRQSFTVEEDALDGFAVKSSVSGETDGLTLEYELSDAASGEIVREGSVKAPKIKNGKFYKIKFEETVAESSGKEWELALRVKGASAEHNLAFFYTAGEGAGKLSVNGNAVDGTWVMRTVTHKFDIETFLVALGFVVYIVVFMRMLYRLFK